MSRCLPFPPPGYVKDGADGDEVLELLKLHRELAQYERRREERKKKKKRKKHRDNEDEVKRQKKCDDDGKDKDDRGTKYQGKMDNHRGREHTHPGLTKEVEPVNDCSEKYELAPKFAKEKSSTSPSHAVVTSNPHGMNSKCDKDLGGCLMGESEFPPIVNMTSFEGGSMLETQTKYRELIVNWDPPPLQLIPIEDEEWLSKKTNSFTTKITDQTKRVSSDIHQGVQPYAYYLPDADMYALPYTLPF